MASSETTTDHDTIRAWVEARGGRPAVVRDTDDGDSAVLRIDFEGDGDDAGLEVVEWEEFFEIFDENGLAFLYQERTKSGALSRFNKFVRDPEADDDAEEVLDAGADEDA
jgi:hypothetical protein